MKVNVVNPPVTGWLEVDLTKDDIDHLQSCIDAANIDKRTATHTLAGHIESSLFLEDIDDQFMRNVLLPCATKFAQEFPGSFSKIDCDVDRTKLHLQSLWVNYQNQHEFNPMHSHTGVFSFVVWMKIPTKSEEQHSLFDMEGCTASDFHFTYLDTTGKINNHFVPMDPEKEGKMLFFSSQFNHGVYPFYNCEEQRISVSGNLFYG